jgi:hypothetical protein
MENKFRFYIQNKAGLYYYLNGNVVALTSTKTPLNYAPQNWDITQLDWERGFKYHGIVRKTSTSFEFHKDSATILRSIYYASGVNGYAKFVIEIFNDSLAVQNYQLLYDGEINFVSYRSTLYGVKSEIIEGGFLNKLESRASTNYEIDLFNNPNQIWVKMDGINFEFRIKWTSTSGITLFKNLAQEAKVGLTVLSYEGTNLNYGTYDSIPTNNPSQNFNELKLLQNISGVPQTNTLVYNANFNTFIPTVPGGDGYIQVLMAIVNSSNTIVSINVIYQDPVLLLQGQSKVTNLPISWTFTLNNGDYIFVFYRVRNVADTANRGAIFTELGSSMDFTFPNKQKTTYIKCLRPKYVFSELINKIGDNTTTADSQLLDLNEDKVITSFDSIRNLPNSKLNTNFDDFYKSMNNIYNTCLSYDKVNDLVLLEEKNYVYDNSNTVLNLGEISEFEIIPHNNDLFSKLEASYKNYDYDNVNGKDEFNCLNEFLSPLTAVSTSLNLSDTYRADMYGIELTRINLSGKIVTDGDSDNDVGVIHIGNTIAGQIPPGNAGEGEDYYELYRDNTLTITNIYSPQTAYNIFFSPKRCLLRQGDYLRSLLYGNDTELIKYQISSKNNYLGLKMVTNDGVTIIDEGADILISSLDNIIFKPTIFQFKTNVNISLNTIMNTTPYQLCSFTFKNNTYYGFFIKSSLQPAFNETQTFRLLCAPQTDLTNLIY